MSRPRPAELGQLTWPEVDGADRPLVLAVPLGSCEQHGPHLPLDTDTRLAVAWTRELAARRDGVLASPPVSIGASGEHESFPGTLSIGTDALVAVLVELVRSAVPPPGSDRPAVFEGVVLVNGHGGNVEAVGRAVELLSAEGRQVLAWHPVVPGGDSHAGRTETSMLLHLDPSCVRSDRVEVGSTARWREVGEVVRSRGLAAVTPNGVLGDPTKAGAEEGRRVFEGLATDLLDAFDAWRATLSA